MPVTANKKNITRHTRRDMGWSKASYPAPWSTISQNHQPAQLSTKKGDPQSNHVMDLNQISCFPTHRVQTSWVMINYGRKIVLSINIHCKLAWGKQIIEKDSTCNNHPNTLNAIASWHQQCGGTPLWTTLHNNGQGTQPATLT